MPDAPVPTSRRRVPSGVPGLDALLKGGLPGERIYLVSGGPGSGKTTLGFQFLLEGVDRVESCLYVSLLQTREEISDVARSHGWDLDGLTLVELPDELREQHTPRQTIFNPAEVELDEITDTIVEKIAELRPKRMVLDSLSELGVLVDTPFQMRRQLMKLKHAWLEAGTTAIVTAGDALARNQPTTQTIVNGAIHLRQETPGFGQPRRRIEITKVRGIDFRGGLHEFEIETGGIAVYPRLGEPEDGAGKKRQVIASGNAELDALFGGGLHRGSACLVMGTSGSGKSTLASLYASAVAGGGGFASVYCLDESRATLLQRSRGLELGIADHIDAGRIDLRDYDIGGLLPGRLMRDLREDVEQRGAQLVVIDSINGLLQLMPHIEHPIAKLHEILRFLSHHNVLTIATANLHGVSGELQTQLDTSYLADSVVLMRHFEAAGSVRQCISVLKQRHGRHERTIREVNFVTGGLELGPPLEAFSGVLSGHPVYHGEGNHLMSPNAGWAASEANSDNRGADGER